MCQKIEEISISQFMTPNTMAALTDSHGNSSPALLFSCHSLHT